MDLNYQYLRYFWTVAREGSVTAAAKRLHLAPSTVSAQVRLLQEELGHPLLERTGRGMLLTEHGEVVLRYADDIFALGEELLDVIRSDGRPRHAYRLKVGVATNLPKTVALRLLSPCLSLPDFPVHLVVSEDHAEPLIGAMSVHHLDLVLVDKAVAIGVGSQLESVRLGASGVSLMAAPAVAARHLVDFPRSLDGAPMLLPDSGSAMRRLLEIYFADAELRPHVVAEFADSALMKAFGRTGRGIFPVPSLVADEVAQEYGVVELGQIEGLAETFYAVLVPGRRANPAVSAILTSARQIFGSIE
ncbi:MAG: LysR family transcriptional regulator [Proteobacteria bacterium]|nr:LysR family transcriptional regulator [Pseudomonadota bacterium]MCP4916185.1 LysR family transcriptional regulator [Pseudomonadota bacterium]